MKGFTNAINNSKDNIETLNVTLKTNQQEHTDLVGVGFTLSYGNYTKSFTWEGRTMTIEVPAYVTYTITYEGVEDYKKPEDVTFTAHGGNSRSVTALYQTELVDVALNSSDGSSVNGAVVLINGKSRTWDGTNIKQKVAFGTEYSVEPQSLDGFTTPSSRSFVAEQAVREVSFTYIASALKVNILSNQSTESSWDPTITNIKAAVAYGSTTLEVSNGQQIDIPTDQEVTITFPSVEGYKTPDTIKFTNTNGGVVEKTGTYQTQLLTVNVTYSGTAPSGYIITGKDSGGNVLFTQAVAFATHKIPYGTSYTVSASKLDGYDAVADQSGVANSTSNTITMTYVHNPVKDLSMMDVYGNPINRSTANCYVVREAGQYKFPLVYGNAIKNGKVNTAAFTNNGGSYSHDFVNGNGDVITRPYIDISAMVVEPSLCNTDTEGVISNIEFIEEDSIHYMKFTVNEIPSNGANAIIGLASVASFPSTYWSWHIWLWSHDLSPVEITNSTGVKYNIMPVNLASKYDSDGVHIKNWFYQWGRPNPMLLPSAWNSNTDHTPGTITKASKASSLLYGLWEPTTFYCNTSYPNYWFGDKSYYNLWDAACTSTGSSDNDTVKTVYDPCPVGWKVPNGNTFAGLSFISTVNGIANLRRYSGDSIGVKFPLSGIRISHLSYAGERFYVWTSASHTSYGGSCLMYYFGGGTNNILPTQSQMYAYGCSIRPVQDDNIQLDVIMINFTISGTTYQAESGMTWFEWVHSEYNVDKGFDGKWMVSSDNNKIYDRYGMNIQYPSGNDVKSSEIIQGSVNYTEYIGPS